MSEYPVFKFPVAPCTYHMRCKDERIICADGTYRPQDDKELEELTQKSQQGLLRELKSVDMQSDFQSSVDPTSKTFSEQTEGVIPKQEEKPQLGQGKK